MGSSAEDKQRFVAAMGPELGAQYAVLWQEMAYLHLTWLEFRELFGTKKSRVELLNRASGLFSRIVQDALWEGVILHIARLTDAPSSLGKPNLTIQSLPKLVVDPLFQRRLNGLCERALTASSFAKDLRNRHIAHRDLNLALEQSAAPLPQVSRLQVAAALEALTAVLNATSRHYMQEDTSFQHIDRHNGAHRLLHVLNDGLTAEKLREQRFLGGDFSALDSSIDDL